MKLECFDHDEPTELWTGFVTVEGECIGYLNCDGLGVEAFNRDKALLGVFAEAAAAHDAIFDGWDGILRSNGRDHPSNSGGAPHQADRAQLEAFVMALFKHATAGNWVSLRAFFEDRADLPPFTIAPIKLNGNFDGLIKHTTLQSWPHTTPRRWCSARQSRPSTTASVRKK